MDAAFFRFLGPELAQAMLGVRIDTVYRPAPGFWTIAFTPPVYLGPEHAPEAQRFLLVRVHPQHGVLFLSPDKPVNPASPHAQAMRLRKFLRGRKLAGFALDWPNKRLALELSPGLGRYLLLGLNTDPDILDDLPPDFARGPAWTGSLDAANDPASPRSLRRALEDAAPADRDGLVHDFLAGQTQFFFLDPAQPLKHGPLPWPDPARTQSFPTALEAGQAYGQSAFFAELAPKEADPAKAKVRQAKRLATLDQDERRLTALLRSQLFGEAIAANLADLQPRAKLASLELAHPEQGLMPLPLDPGKTLLENMEDFFRKAAKARRGLEHVKRLRAEAQEGRFPEAKPRRSGQTGSKPGRPEKTQSAKNPPALRRFRTSDGFAIIRGKNATANHRLLSELASPFDYWFHAEGGPGAHVVLKRDHPGQAVPARSLDEAACLAGLASWQAGEAKARIIWAEVSRVRKIKGAAMGQVSLDSAKSLTVALDPGLEDRLAQA
jgi:hypothetical protein